MTSNLHAPSPGTEQHPAGAARHALALVVQSIATFWTKFNNDWTWQNAAGLAYNLILAVFPIVMTLLAILSFALNTSDPGTYQRAVDVITSISSTVAEARPVVDAAVLQVSKATGFIAVIAFVLALFNGSRLFMFMEDCLDIIYQVRPRGVLAKNLLSMVMLLLFVLLFPIAVVASAFPELVYSLLAKTTFSQVPGSNLVFGLGGILCGVIAWYLMFQLIYLVVPNQKISFRESWPGAVVGAVLLELYLALFPIAVEHLFGVFAGTLGLLILLIFFYYFGLIVFLGAELNAYLKGVREMPTDLVTMVPMMIRHFPASALSRQTRASHTRSETHETGPAGDERASAHSTGDTQPPRAVHSAD